MGKLAITWALGGGSGIDARVRGATNFLPISDDDQAVAILGDMDVRVYSHDARKRESAIGLEKSRLGGEIQTNAYLSKNP